MKFCEIECFEIIVDKQIKRVYIGGEELNGEVRLKLRNRLKITSLKLTFKGNGLVDWNNIIYKWMKVYAEHFVEEEEYINLDIIQFFKITKNDFYLEAGEEIFPFKIQLPSNIPTSFDHENARIRYSLKAYIEGCSDNSVECNRTTHLTLNIISPVDLNMSASVLMLPKSVEKIKIVNFLFFSAPIEANFSIFKSGYVPGERLKFLAIINNKTLFDIQKVVCWLVQIIKCKTKISECDFQKVVLKENSNLKFTKNSCTRWESSLKIPPICATSDNKSKIIDISYQVKLLIKPTFVHKCFHLFIPITIGTKPLLTEDKSLTVFKNYIFKFEPVDSMKDKISESNSNMTLYYPFYDGTLKN